MFRDISRFNNINDYLPIITAILIVEIMVIMLTYSNMLGKNLKLWYQQFLLSALLADVLIIFLGVILARAIYYYIFDTFSIINLILIILVIQIVHDILFYLIIITIPRGSNKMIDLFKDYADEVSYRAILGDSMMIIATGLIASYLANFDANINIIISAVLIYLLQYIIYNY
jgi:hypothetical protein